jgi:hypothetical protein
VGVLREEAAEVGIWDLNGDLETRLLFRICLYEVELRLARLGSGTLRDGDSCLAILRGEIWPLDPFSVSDGELHPRPDSLRIEVLIGSGELERSRSRSGECVGMLRPNTIVC